MVCGAAWSAADAQQSNNGHHYGWRNRDRHQNYNQCGSNQYGRQHGQQRRNENDNDNDDNDRDDDRNGQYGQYNNGQYGQYGNCAGQYGNGQNRGNAVVRGTIVGVSGNQVTLQTNNGGYNNNGGYGGYGQTITINDQPALDNRTSGRVAAGRYVTAYGYWQNGVFYATEMD